MRLVSRGSDRASSYRLHGSNLGLLEPRRKGVPSCLLACSDAQKEDGMPIPKAISLTRPDAIVLSVPKFLVGTWVTSFDAWYPGSPSDGLLPIKVANSFVKWLVPSDKWDQGWNDFLENPANEEEIEALSLIFPAPVATLSYFVFAADGTFHVNYGRNLGWGYEPGEGDGVFNVGWNNLGVAIGDIIFLQEDTSGHPSEFPFPVPRVPYMTIKFILLSTSEMKFIVAHGPTVDDPAQVAAGTMRRLRLRRRRSIWERVLNVLSWQRS
jgi:hypothetical protein